MRILVIHNSYQTAGGEDVVFESEVKLLRSHGHVVFTYRESNTLINDLTRKDIAVRAFWSSSSYSAIKQKISEAGHIDVVHVHNTFPLMSPSVVYAAKKANIPTVVTLHNYRLICPASTLFRNGAVCQACIGRSLAIPGMVRRCYHASALETGLVAATNAVHNLAKTWLRKVDRHIALSEFAKSRFVDAGLPSKRVVVKPNFTEDPGGEVDNERHGAMFIGRLNEEKGLRVLFAAWKNLDLDLEVVGEGPLDKWAKANCPKRTTVRGNVPHPTLMQELGRKYILVVPSIWFEPFGLVIIEAFARGVPVIASRVGAIAEIIDNGRTGLLFEPGQPDDLARRVKWAIQNPSELAQIARHARKAYEQKYTPHKNHEMLMQIYADAIR